MKNFLIFIEGSVLTSSNAISAVTRLPLTVPKHNGRTYSKCTEYGGKHGAVWIDEELLINQIRKLLKSIQLPKKLILDLVSGIEKNHANEQERYTDTIKRLQKEFDELDAELVDLFKDRKQFKSRHELFERMVKDIGNKRRLWMTSKTTVPGTRHLLLVPAIYSMSVVVRLNYLTLRVRK